MTNSYYRYSLAFLINLIKYNIISYINFSNIFCPVSSSSKIGIFSATLSKSTNACLNNILYFSAIISDSKLIQKSTIIFYKNL